MIKVLDVFSGAGGFSCGFHLSRDYEIVGAIEIDAWASETFAFNHKGATVLNADITTLSESDIIQSFGSKVDVIIGGPPCQGYSICNKDAGDPKDPRNTLFTEFLRITSLLNPEIVIMENVPNLLKAKTESKELVIDIIHKELEKLGYYVYSNVLEATQYGVPQIRKRLFVIGSKTKLDNPFPLPTHKDGSIQDIFSGQLPDYVTLWDAISDLPDIEAREGSEETDYTSEPKNEFQQMLRQGSEKVYNHVAMKHSKRLVERFKAMSWGDSVTDVPDELKPHVRGNVNVKSEKAYDQNNRRMHPDKPCHTIPASFYANFVHPYKHRNFTAREGARIQTFPDWFVFKGKPTVVSHKLLEREGRQEEKHLCQYNQIGNAVPPLLAKAIADNIKPILLKKVANQCMSMA
ncbi:DNA cytosine methyltransferase [Brevibacillus laterosporus]|uniref:Cytosine-specific methyltransferase n=1 Tax=Brevibacillus laterosporus TaxID=1465 RepID=A0A0F7EGJ1_BRELA|nr:DNA methyltransferase [Brevibacillus laterosporus]